MTALTISKEAADWLVHGERGISSEAIWHYLLLGHTTDRWYSDHPSDPSDFQRCRLLLEAVPELRASFHLMADRSPVWAALVRRWDEIDALYVEEVTEATGYARRTYALMREIIDAAEGRAQERTP